MPNTIEPVPFEPRCLKSWRSFEAWHVSGGTPTEVVLVDQFDNHVCGAAATPPDGAMYVRGDLKIGGSNRNPDVNLNLHRLYYGGVLDGDPEDFIGGQPTRLVITQYGDFNGNCLVDNDDVAKISSFVTQIERCSWPLADLDGDCIVNGIELTVVLARAVDGGYPHPDCNSEQEPFPDEVCLNAIGGLNGGGGSPGSFELEISQEQAVRLSDALVGYVSTRDPRSGEELVKISGIFDSLAEAATMYLTATERREVARMLEDPDVEYISEDVEALVPAITRRLRE